MSTGVIWYKTQPDAEITRALDELLAEYCGEIRSHDATVVPGKMVKLLGEVLRSHDTAVIVGGLDAMSPEENTVYLLGRALNVPLERGGRSRSRFCHNTLHGWRLPSLEGSVLFPSRFEGAEGILLMSGRQTVMVLPAQTRTAVTVAVSMRRFLAPYFSADGGKEDSPKRLTPPKDYQKFQRRTSARRAVTREYTARQLEDVMAHAAQSARRRYRDTWEMPEEREDGIERELAARYRKLSSAALVRRILSLILVFGAIAALVITLLLLDMR